jgi:hypothetical protein
VTVRGLVNGEPVVLAGPARVGPPTPPPEPAADPPLRGPVVPPEVRAARLAACSTCPHRSAELDSCGLLSCGCPVGILAARPWSKCPLARWPITAPVALLPSSGLT